jgi:cobalamin transport system substrate-binding protein
MKNLFVSLTILLWIVVLVVPVAAADGPQYATGFSFEQHEEFTLVTVTTPWQAATREDVKRYILYPRGSRPPSGYDDALAIETPVRSVITMSTTFLPHLEQLGVVESLVGHDALSWVYSPAVRARGEAGLVTEVGSGNMVDVEQALALAPDVVFTNSYGGDWDAHPALERAGLPTVISGDWVEQSPLGRAEWILFTALFYDKLEIAEQLFGEIERSYLALSRLAGSVPERPTVLINAPYQGTWSVSGGDSYAAQFISDAGGEYVWAEDGTAGALFLDFETVFAEAGTADIWINPGVWSSLAQGRAEDRRFERFTAFVDGMVFNNNGRVSEGGGIDYFESGAANPHVVLKDLIWAFHPELVPGYQPFYYQQLR